MSAVDGVQQAVVIAREDRPGDQRLVGYVTGTADPTAARKALAEQLPGYMVPIAVVAMEALPMTANGKLDARALPKPERRITLVPIVCGQIAVQVRATFCCCLGLCIITQYPMTVHPEMVAVSAITRLETSNVLARSTWTL